MSNFYDKNGKKITLEQWSIKFKDGNYQRIMLSKLDSDIWVSTVWLGLNHNFSNSDKPLIFETMIFANGDSDDNDMDRYSTLEEAKKGHQAMVNKWLKKGYKLLKENSNETIT